MIEDWMNFEMRLHVAQPQPNCTIEQIVRALANLAGVRDNYLREHQKQVAELAASIARELRLPEAQIDAVYWAALVHDIGKLRIPFEILYKPGKLDETEYRLIQTHPRCGFEILRPLELVAPIAAIVLQHHERLNGSGYPQALRGDQIRLEARILGVADVVEAMACHRPYRPALGIEKALEEITLNREILYDPAAVDACLAVIREKNFRFEATFAAKASAGPG